MKERIKSFDLIRVFSAWIIVMCHYSDICISSEKFANINLFFNYANGKWGETTVVTIFFILSGASLYYNHKEVSFKGLKKYYISRFLGIFPMFYMLWLFLYYKKATAAHNFFYVGNKKSIILTITGMDGYLHDLFPNNYYIIGEWFLGALVILYLVYPLLTWCMKHARLITTVVLVGAFASIYFVNIFPLSNTRHPFTCLLSMWVGMLFIEYKDKFENNITVIVSAVIAAVIIFIHLPIDSLICMQINALCLFIVLNKIADFIMKPAMVDKFISFSSPLTYAIFLLQHVVMSEVLHTFDDYALGYGSEIAICVLTFVVIYIFAVVLNVLNKPIVKALKAKLL